MDDTSIIFLEDARASLKNAVRRLNSFVSRGDNSRRYSTLVRELDSLKCTQSVIDLVLELEPRLKGRQVQHA